MKKSSDYRGVKNRSIWDESKIENEKFCSHPI